MTKFVENKDALETEPPFMTILPILAVLDTFKSELFSRPETLAVEAEIDPVVIFKVDILFVEILVDIKDPVVSVDVLRVEVIKLLKVPFEANRFVVITFEPTVILFVIKFVVVIAVDCTFGMFAD